MPVVRPRLVLRVGFAGRRELDPKEESRLAASLETVLRVIGHRLAAIAPGVPVEAGRKPGISRFYSTETPVLRLITGLCEGADCLAGRVLEHLRIETDTAEGRGVPCLQTELGAVLPFDVQTYRKSRPDGLHAEFDRQLGRCAWVLALDGIFERPVPDTELAKVRRSRAYRAQSTFLLRQSDLLVAATDPSNPGEAGGTLESVREALAFDLPVVFINTGNGSVRLIEPADDLHSRLGEACPSQEQWTQGLDQWVRHLVADPDSNINPDASHVRGDPGAAGMLLDEFFDRLQLPPASPGGRRRRTLRGSVWAWLEGRFATGPASRTDLPVAPYEAYRRRATSLNYHYGGLYRGAFVLNYAFAVLAVVLASVSLMLLGIATRDSTPAGEGAAAHGWMMPALMGLGISKLCILVFISWNTRRANHEQWNDRAVDYRYLAERLRGMYYLPLAGSQQPPAAAPPQFASRVVRQSAVDWLFDALVRSVSPADLEAARPAGVPSHDGTREIAIARLLTLNPSKSLARLRDDWISEQAKYHERSSRTLHGLNHGIERLSKWLGWAVIAVVVADLFLIGGELSHRLPDSIAPIAASLTPWLILVSAVLPAVVAALGGIRFQSECQRLAERSAVMRVMLQGRPGAAPGEPLGRWELVDTLARRHAASVADPATDPGGWSHEALCLTERVAGDFVQEAAEWSVLYAKEVVEPG